MYNIPTDLACHVSFQGLKCLHLSLILGIILEFLEEEINLHSEHVGLLDGVHALLAWLIPPLTSLWTKPIIVAIEE